MIRILTLLITLCITQLLPAQSPYLVVLGTVQDGGSPHIGCQKECCSALFDAPDPERMVVSLGLVDPVAERRYLFEATPDMPRQLEILNTLAPYGDKRTADGVFLTHAHIGHYSGLMYFGREAMNSKNVPVYAMPRMQRFLQNNGPWDQLISLNNIVLKPLSDHQPTILSSAIRVTPIQVPHRDEYSETVGFLIEGPEKSALFIPDIDKWQKWNESITSWIGKVDYAFIDATFHNAGEINNRDMSEIPHPFVVESIQLFRDLPDAEKTKVNFIHFNHTNPLLDNTSEEFMQVQREGFGVARPGQRFGL